MAAILMSRLILQGIDTVVVYKVYHNNHMIKENITKSAFLRILLSPFSLLQIKNVLVPNNLQMAVIEMVQWQYICGKIQTALQAELEALHPNSKVDKGVR